MNPTLSAALAYHKRGWSVITLPYKTKKPMIKWEPYQRRCPSDNELQGWLADGHVANLALVCGQVSGVIVLDIDGAEGEASIKGRELPPTPTVRTGKGIHYYYKHPGGSVRNFAKRLPGLDLRGDGGFVVIPPSVHPSGAAYEWQISPDDVPLADPPAWLLDLIRPAAEPKTPAATPRPPITGDGTPYGLAALRQELDTLAEANVGARNHTLNRCAFVLGQLIAGGELSEGLVVTDLTRIAQDIGLGDEEIATTLDSGLAAGKRVPRAAPETRRATGAHPRAAKTTEPPLDLNAFHRTDAGQGEAIAAIYGDQMRFDHTREQWLVWDGTRWQPDLDGQRETLALDVARQRLAASANEDDKEKRDQLARWALASEGRQRLDSALHLARIQPVVRTTHDKLDRNPWLLACANGVIDLRTGELQAGRPDDMLTLSTTLTYTPGERCDRWRQFLDEIFKGDEDLITWVQRAAGYCLTGQTSEQCLFMCWGTGANGKSVFLSTLRLILGEYGVNTRFDTFIEERNGAIPNDVAALRAARLVTASEVAEGKRLNEGRIKSLTGQDPITARFLHGEFFTFQPEFKLWLAANHKPTIKGTDEAIWRRVRLIPFTAYFGPGQADPTLVDKLALEAPGILGWAVAGCLDWQQYGLGEAQAVKTATATYRAESDILAAFLDERTVRTDTATVRAGELYAAYKTWCDANGDTAITGQAFGRRLTEHGFDKMKDRAGWYYIGLGLAV